MQNPLDLIKNGAEAIEHKIHVAVLKEIAIGLLSRLVTLEPGDTRYQAAIDCVQGDKP